MYLHVLKLMVEVVELIKQSMLVFSTRYLGSIKLWGKTARLK
jgi:hypothetical protein